MFTLIGATVMDPGASLIGISFTSTCGGWPTWLAASKLLPVICHNVDGPASLVPATLRSNFCSVSVAFTTARVRYL